jgi:hypothetical protein
MRIRFTIQTARGAVTLTVSDVVHYDLKGHTINLFRSLLMPSDAQHVTTVIHWREYWENVYDVRELDERIGCNHDRPPGPADRSPIRH